MQLAAVGVIVFAAVVYVLRATWRTWFGSKCGGCGKCAAPVAAKPDGRCPRPQI